MNLVCARRQVNCIAVAQVDLAQCAHGQGFGQSGIMDMKERVRPQMFSHANRALPLAGLFHHIDMFGPDADGVCIVFGGLAALDQVHFG